MRRCRNRTTVCPVILDQEEDWPSWLGEAEGDCATLLRPAPTDYRRVWPVDRRVGSPRNNGPELLETIAAIAGSPIRQVAILGVPGSPAGSDDAALVQPSCTAVTSSISGLPQGSACGPGGELLQPAGLSPRQPPRWWQCGAWASRAYGPRRSLVGDRLPAGHVVADLRHVFA
jgi:hypothetical protein